MNQCQMGGREKEKSERERKIEKNFIDLALDWYSMRNRKKKMLLSLQWLSVSFERVTIGEIYGF